MVAHTGGSRAVIGKVLQNRYPFASKSTTTQIIRPKRFNSMFRGIGHWKMICRATGPFAIAIHPSIQQVQRSSFMKVGQFDRIRQTTWRGDVFLEENLTIIANEWNIFEIQFNSQFRFFRFITRRRSKFSRNESSILKIYYSLTFRLQFGNQT